MPDNARPYVGSHDFLFITLDTLRYDVAQSLFLEGLTPHFAQLLPKTGWEKRHSPGSFTFAAHQAFFAGFLPTPACPGKHPRMFATKFLGSETTTSDTYTFEEADIIHGFEALDYRTICIGGVGFFNQQTALGKILPGFFQESYWEESFGVTDPDSTYNQFQKAIQCLESYPTNQRIFLFINISALHQPNYFYIPDYQHNTDSLESHQAALQYVDQQLPTFINKITQNRDFFVILCADHGTTYGEDGYFGHRLAHPRVWEVPFATRVLVKNFQINTQSYD